jgi:enoyl-CoA hydratase/carnithine racemase
MKKTTPCVRVETAEDIGVVTIHRPGDRNAIDTEMIKALTDTLAAIEQSAARAVIFTGSGDTYSPVNPGSQNCRHRRINQ